MPPRKRPADLPPEQGQNLEDAVTGLSDQVGTLASQIEVLRVAIDDLREELQFAIRNLPREPWVPSPPLTSMPKDPLAEDFVVNRTSKEDLPPNDAASITVPAATSHPEPRSDSKVELRPPKSVGADGASTPSLKSKPASKKRVRLDLKLYFDSAYADIVRFIGYGGKPLKAVQAFVQSLEKKHGREKLKEAGEAVAVIDGNAEPYMVRLKDEVRRLAVQMLGAPPESKQPT